MLSTCVRRENELTRKLELGKEEYTKKATEVNDLSRQLKKVQVCEHTEAVLAWHRVPPTQQWHAVTRQWLA